MLAGWADWSSEVKSTCLWRDRGSGERNEERVCAHTVRHARSPGEIRLRSSFVVVGIWIVSGRTIEAKCQRIKGPERWVTKKVVVHGKGHAHPVRLASRERYDADNEHAYPEEDEDQAAKNICAFPLCHDGEVFPLSEPAPPLVNMLHLAQGRRGRSTPFYSASADGQPAWTSS
eukprot:745926-Rhodomonas_salina.2